VYFSHFGMLYQRKSGRTAVENLKFPESINFANLHLISGRRSQDASSHSLFHQSSAVIHAGSRRRSRLQRARARYRCYDFLNIFAEKFCEKNVVFGSKQS
jgi:hypothetical protein